MPAPYTKVNLINILIMRWHHTKNLSLYRVNYLYCPICLWTSQQLFCPRIELNPRNISLCLDKRYFKHALFLLIAFQVKNRDLTQIRASHKKYVAWIDIKRCYLALRLDLDQMKKRNRHFWLVNEDIAKFVPYKETFVLLVH